LTGIKPDVSDCPLLEPAVPVGITVVMVAVWMKVVGIPWSVWVTVATEIKTTVVGVGAAWDVTVIVGKFNTPPDSVSVRVWRGLGPPPMTVVIPDFDGAKGD